MTFEFAQSLRGAEGAFIGQYCLENTEILQGRRYDCYYDFKTTCAERGGERNIALIINKKFTSIKFPRLHLTIQQKARGRFAFSPV